MPKKKFYKQSSKVESASTSTLLEVEKPTKFRMDDVMSDKVKPKFVSYGAMAALILFTLIVFFVGILGLAIYSYTNSLQTATGLDIRMLISKVYQKRNENIISAEKPLTLLLMGIDQTQNNRENFMLTDTMIVVRVNHNGKITLTPIPRDLWIESLKARVNSLYYYGQQSNKDDGIALVKSVVSEMSGIDIDYYAIINMDTLKKIVDILGGVDVEVERAFTDKFYPREIDVNSKDMSVLYETVSFEKGIMRMNGDTSLKYIRSRHSEDKIEGNDTGREKRQQQLILALKNKLGREKLMLMDPKIVKEMFTIYKNDLITNVGIEDLARLAWQLKSKSVIMETINIPITNETSKGILYHPDKGPYNQWVYLPYDNNWSQLKQWFLRTNP